MRYRCIKAFPLSYNGAVTFTLNLGDEGEFPGYNCENWPEYFEPIQEDGKIEKLLTSKGYADCDEVHQTNKINEIIEKLNALEAKPDKPVVAKERWTPQVDGEGYYHLDEKFDVGEYFWHNDGTDRRLFKCFNMFSTEAQAIQAAELVKEVLINFHNSL